MADDSERIREQFKFHPCDTPRGMMYYKLSELPDEQQGKLNSHKIATIRENQIYLQEHPEVKIIISVLLRAILRARPKVTLREFLSKYFSRAWSEMQTEIDKYLEEKAKEALGHYRTGPSASTVMTLGELEEEGGEPSVHMPHEAKICRSILHDIIIDMKSTTKFRSETLSSEKDTLYPSIVTLCEGEEEYIEE